MKIPLSVVVLLLSLIVFAPAVTGQTTSTGQTCACQAPDSNGCKATATCQNGCTALCGPKDACFATCGTIGGDELLARITLSVKNEDGSKIASRLSEKTGRKIIFIPNPKVSGPIASFDLKDAPLWNALDLLSKYGKVLISGVPIDKLKELRKRMNNGEKVSMHFTDTPVTDAVAELAFVSGKPFRVTGGDGEKHFSMSLEGVTLDQMIDRISAQTGVKIEQAGDE